MTTSPDAARVHPGPQAPIRFLALGDSYTIGEGVPEAGRWPVILAARLRAEGVPLADPEIIAVTGWTTDELAAGIDAAGPVGPFGLVSLLIGVNNQYRGRALDEYREQFVELLSRAVGFAGGDAGRVVVVSIPDWGVTRFAEGRDRARIAREIDAFNTVNRLESLGRGVAWVDVTGISRDAGDAPDQLAQDGLHPSGSQYAAWAGAILPVVRGLLTADTGGTSGS
jgi:lysophospholipase L1-like esterase